MDAKAKGKATSGAEGKIKAATDALAKIAEKTRPIIHAAKDNLPAFVTALLWVGKLACDVNAQDSLGKTALMYAICNNDADMVQHLFTAQEPLKVNVAGMCWPLGFCSFSFLLLFCFVSFCVSFAFRFNLESNCFVPTTQQLRPANRRSRRSALSLVRRWPIRALAARLAASASRPRPPRPSPPPPTRARGRARPRTTRYQALARNSRQRRAHAH
jgi:hypothetical protein